MGPRREGSTCEGMAVVFIHGDEEGVRKELVSLVNVTSGPSYEAAILGGWKVRVCPRIYLRQLVCARLGVPLGPAEDERALPQRRDLGHQRQQPVLVPFDVGEGALLDQGASQHGGGGGGAIGERDGR